MDGYSYQTGHKRTFHVADYTVFACTLIISAAIGLYYAIKDRKKNTTDEYLLAGRGMHPAPVAMSLVSTFISAITILGTPSEVYVHSTMYWWLCAGLFICATGSACIFVPIFYNLGITSVFEYLEMRFGKTARFVLTTAYLINMMFYMAIVLYTPALALNAVTGLSLWGSVTVIGLVCIFYTALGGMKAVVWADTLQMTIVYAGMLTILVQGSIVLGGFSNAWDIADRGGRIVLFELSPDPRVRHSIWTVAVGGGIIWMANFGINQATVQRTMSVSSVTKTKVALWLMVPGIIAIISLSCLAGIVMYAFYAKCDPIKFGLIEKADQLFPLYMMDLLGKFNGLPGLMLSCIFSGCLSTVSSGLNAISAVMLEDYAKQFCCHKLSPAKATLLSKFFVVLFGLLGLVLAFVVSQIGGMILQLTYTLFGVISGPMLGIFTLGILFPWANKTGALVGYTASLLIALWIGFGASLTQTNTARWPGVSTEGCNWNITSGTKLYETPLNLKTTPVPDTSSIIDKYTGIQQLYTLSYLWLGTVAAIITVVVGMIVSLLTGPTDPVTLNPKLICPIFDVFFFFLPEKILKRLRCGVRHGEFDDEEMLTDQASRKAKLDTLTKKDDPIGGINALSENSQIDYHNPAYQQQIHKLENVVGGNYQVDFHNPAYQDRIHALEDSADGNSQVDYHSPTYQDRMKILD